MKRTMVSACASRARQRLVGWSLRAYRESAGLSLADAARVIGCHFSKVSRIESGQRSVRAEQLRALLAEYGADEAAQQALARLARPCRVGTGWWSPYGAVLPAPAVELASVEACAASAAVYAPLQVPQLLQVPGYARAVAAANPLVPAEHEDTAVAAALDRRHAVLEQQALPLEVVIGEAALRQRACTATAMRTQLAYLADAPGAFPHLTIRLVPFTAGPAPAGGAGGFTVLRFGQVPGLAMAHLDGPAGGLCPGTPETAEAYLRAFGRLQDHAVKPEHTTRRLRELIRAM